MVMLHLMVIGSVRCLNTDTMTEERGQQFIRSYVSSRDGQAADEEFAVVNYFDKTEAGQVVALNPIT